ncbi:MAG: hypothetical protein FWE32_06780 [Oscillospiraceae bacterium]|nr:hypothetical protein [Oscillospiraceae bacterium]
MSEQGYGVLEAVVGRTGSELILFFVILAIFAIPFYIVVLKGRKADKAHEREQQQQLLKVVSDNTAVMAGLKATLDTSKVDTKATLDRIHNRIDDISVDVARINAKVDTTIASQTEIASKVNKTLLIVSSTPQTSGEN